MLALTAVHFFFDMLGGMVPAILPVIRAEFALTLKSGLFILACLYITANGVQILTGHMRCEKTKPLFLQLGLILATCICLLAVLPRTTAVFPLLILVTLVSGTGIAIAHPEGLRAVHALGRLPATQNCTVFVTDLV